MDETLLESGWGRFGPKRRLFFTSIMGAYIALGIWQILSQTSFYDQGSQFPNLSWLLIASIPGVIALVWYKGDIVFRAMLGLAFFYCMAVMGFLLSQWVSALWLLSASLLAAMFVGFGASAATQLINLGLLITAAYLAHNSHSVLPAGSAMNTSQWIWSIAGFMFFCAAITFSYVLLMGSLRTSLVKLTKVTDKLKKEQEQLRLESEAHCETAMQLEKSEAQFRLLAQNVVDILWSANLDLELTYISPSVEMVLGIKPSEALHMSFDKHMPSEDFAELSRLVSHTVKSEAKDSEKGHGAAFDMRMFNADGEIVWLSTSMGVMRDDSGEPVGIQGISRNVTRRKAADEELKAKSKELEQAYEELHTTRKLIQTSRNKLKAIFDGLSDPIISVTPDGEVESMNLAAAAFAQSHPRDLVGLSASEYLNRIDLPLTVGQTALEAFRDMRDSQSYQWRLVEYPSKDGPMFMELNLTPVIDGNGETSLGIIHFVDVTEIKRLEIQIRRYNEELENMVAERTAELTQAHRELQDERDRLAQANNELQRLDQLRHDLTNMVVHDMKGPLAELMGNLDLLCYDLDKQQRDETLDLATMGARDLLRMIMNLLDIDRLEEDQLRAHKQTVDFAPLAQRVVDKFTTMIRLKGLNITIDDSRLPQVHADPDLLERVIQNLLTNALQYTEQGGITISAQSNDQGDAVVSVADTGKGIPRKAHDLIFRKFMQASDSGGPRTSTGLGLTFCQLATKAHGGDIWFESEEGRGSTFYVSLPAETGQPAD